MTEKEYGRIYLFYSIPITLGYIAFLLPTWLLTQGWPEIMLWSRVSVTLILTAFYIWFMYEVLSEYKIEESTP